MMIQTAILLLAVPGVFCLTDNQACTYYMYTLLGNRSVI